MEYSFGNLTWGEFKELLERKLKDQGCDNPDSAVIESLDLVKPGVFKREGVVSYYSPGNSFYVVS